MMVRVKFMDATGGKYLFNSSLGMLLETVPRVGEYVATDLTSVSYVVTAVAHLIPEDVDGSQLVCCYLEE